MTVNVNNPTELMNALLGGQQIDATGEAAPAADGDVGEQSTEERDNLNPNVLDDWEMADAVDNIEEPDTADDTSVSKKKKTAEESDAEYIKADGKKIKVDYADKAKIKKAYELAAGMRKFQKERDEAIKREKEKEEKLSKQEELWGKIEAAADAEDFNTLMKIMTKGKMDFDTLLSSKIERMKLREDATEEEAEKMDLHDEIASLKASLAKVTSDVTKKQELAEAAKEQAELQNLEAKIHPAFDKYRFHGKLGDADAEQQLDEMLWAKVINNLDDYDGKLDAEIINKEFSKVAAAINKVVNKQTERTVKKTTEARKRNAKETAQLEQVRGYVDSGLKQEAAAKIKSGDLTHILQNWGKFGKLF